MEGMLAGAGSWQAYIVVVMFMVSARESARRVDEHVSFIGAAVAAGVRHVVYTSLYQAAADAVFTFARDHWATEEHIRASGLRWTFLRNCLYLDLVPMIGARRPHLRSDRTSYLAIAAGQQAGLSDDVERITGQPPVGLREMLSRS